MNNNNNMDQKLKEMKYNKQGRLCLLLLCILSAVNIVLIFALDMFFYFSAYIVNVFAATGALVASQTGSNGVMVVFALLALAVVAVYFVCWLLSKKNYIWMIVALVLFAIDSVLLLVDCIGGFTSGDGSFIYMYIMNIVFHAFIIYYLVVAVIQGKAAKKNGMPTVEDILGENPEAKLEGEAQEQVEESAYADVMRTITITRAKAFTGCAVAMSIYVDGKEQTKVKNGQTIQFTVTGAKHEMVAFFGSTGESSEIFTIPEGETDKNYTIKVKAGFTAVHIEFIETM